MTITNIISDKKGFSLIELLISAFISALILVVLFGLLNSMLKQTMFQNEEFKSSLLYLKEILIIQLNSSADSFEGEETKFLFNSYLKDGKNIFYTNCVYEIVSSGQNNILVFKRKKHDIGLNFKSYPVLSAERIKFEYEYSENILKEFKLKITRSGKDYEIKIPVL